MARKKRPVKLVVSLVCAASLIVAATGFSNAALSETKIHKGVSITGVGVGGLTKDEAVQRLNDAMDGKEAPSSLVITFDGEDKTLDLGGIDLQYSLDYTADLAQKVGREGGTLENLAEIISAGMRTKDIPLSLTFDGGALKQKVSDLIDSETDSVTDYMTDVGDSGLKVTMGQPGKSFDKDTVFEEVAEHITNDGKGGLSFISRVTDPKEIFVNELYDRVFTEPKNARYEVSDDKVSIVKESDGISFDKAEAEGIIAQNKQPGNVFYIPVKRTAPDIRTFDLEGKLFADILGEYSTTYNSGDVSRSFNLELASGHINGKVFAPGGSFSYNEIVGKRTAAAGFKPAIEYVNGESVPGIGGGVCQVSTTIYNAALLADMQIVSRLNHMLTVSYVPLGQDATVVDGAIDFVFSNNTNYPIKIVSTAGRGRVTMKILGTKEDKALKVVIENRTVGSIPFTEKITEDPNMPAGKTEIEQRGANGYIVDTYKTVTRSGQPPVTTKISNSRYQAKVQKVKLGTGAPEVSPPPEATPAVPGTAEETPVVTSDPGAAVPSVTPSATPSAAPLVTPSVMPQVTPASGSNQPDAKTPSAVQTVPPVKTPETAASAEPLAPVPDGESGI